MVFNYYGFKCIYLQKYGYEFYTPMYFMELIQEYI